MFSGRTAWFVWLCCGFQQVAMCLGAATDLEDEFAALARAYRSDMEQLRGPLLRIYLRELKELETFYVRGRYYNKAIACRDERLRAQNEAGPGVPAGSDGLRLLASRAANMRGLRLDTGRHVLIMNDELLEAGASWELHGLPAGGYEVFIECEVTRGSATVKLQEARFFVAGKMVRDAAQPGLHRHSIGNLKVTDGRAVARLVVSRADRSSQIALKSVILVPNAP